MIAFHENTDFKDFLLGLDDAGLIKLKAKDYLEIPSKSLFLEFGYGIFLLWIHIFRRPHILRAFFTGIEKDKTLLLISPYRESPYFSVPEKYVSGQFYIEKLKEDYRSTDGFDCKFCDILNSICMNVNFFKVSQALGNFLNQDTQRAIYKGLRPKPPCGLCRERILKWLRSSLLKDERYGALLGGYGTVLKIESKPFEFLFKAPLDEHRTVGTLFDFFLTVFIASELNSNIFTADSTLKTPFFSYEIDCGAFTKNDSQRRLFIVETTSAGHPHDKLKNKALTYSALREIEGLSFKYLYVTMSARPVVLYKDKTTKVLSSNDQEVATLWTILGSKAMEFHSLSPSGFDLESALKRDWWDKAILRKSFDTLIGKVEDLCRHLNIP